MSGCGSSVGLLAVFLPFSSHKEGVDAVKLGQKRISVFGKGCILVGYIYGGCENVVEALQRYSVTVQKMLFEKSKKNLIYIYIDIMPNLG